MVGYIAYSYPCIGARNDMYYAGVMEKVSPFPVIGALQSIKKKQSSLCTKNYICRLHKKKN